MPLACLTETLNCSVSIVARQPAEHVENQRVKLPRAQTFTVQSPGATEPNGYGASFPIGEETSV